MSHNRHLLPRQEVWIHKDSLPNECGLRRLEDEGKSGKLGFFLPKLPVLTLGPASGCRALTKRAGGGYNDGLGEVAITVFSWRKCHAEPGSTG
jgi:hypothetical protein